MIKKYETEEEKYATHIQVSFESNKDSALEKLMIG
jgi:hypothetical protein